MPVGPLVALGLLAAGCTVDFGVAWSGDAGISPLCGNGLVDPGEACDDGNHDDGDDCRWDCGQDLTVCGNGAPDPGETCDDGNHDVGDGCDATCQAEYCDETVCPAGCCTPDGECLPGTATDQCGTGGQACLDCNIEGHACDNQVCGDTGPCNPGETAECDPCGERICGGDGLWGSCESQGECSPGALDTGAVCGDCGVEERTCTQSCVWGDYTCVNEGVCAEGAVDSGGDCGDCGDLERTCNSSCQWGAWNCVGEGPCSPGQQYWGGYCGYCGTEYRDCGNNCTWNSWQCVGQGVCSPGAIQTQSCQVGMEQGLQDRICNSSCEWGEWGQCWP